MIRNAYMIQKDEKHCKWFLFKVNRLNLILEAKRVDLGYATQSLVKGKDGNSLYYTKVN